MSSPLPPDWYPDPSSSSSRVYRWWDGQAWTKHTAVGQPAAHEVPAPAVAPAPSYAAQYSNEDSCMAPSQVLAEAPIEVPVGSPAPAAPKINGQSIWQRNQSAMITMGTVAIYLLLAVKTHIVMLGVWPFMTSIRSWQRKEPLAGLAMCAAVVAVLVAILGLSGH